MILAFKDVQKQGPIETNNERNAFDVDSIFKLQPEVTIERLASYLMFIDLSS